MSEEWKPPERRPLPMRAAVQAEHDKPRGTIAWWEHQQAWSAYAAKFGNDQSPLRIHERQGFGYYELAELLGGEPTTWEPL